jgi:hypothetical protein
MTKNDILRNAARSSGLDVYGLGLDRDKWEGALARYTEIVVRECIVVAADAKSLEAAVRIKLHFGVTE